mgnify:CR=1 FL=1
MDFIITPALVIAAITGVVQIAKIAGLNSRYAPLLALTLGVFYSVSANGFFVNSMAVGTLMGLSAAGMWDFAKVTILGK